MDTKLGGGRERRNREFEDERKRRDVGRYFEFILRDPLFEGGMGKAVKRPDPKIKAKPCINYRIKSSA